MNTPKASGAARLRAPSAGCAATSRACCRRSRSRRRWKRCSRPKNCSAMAIISSPRQSRDALRDVERAVQQRRRRRAVRRADDLAERAGQPAEEAVGRHPAGIVEQVAHDGRRRPRAHRDRARRQSRRTCRCSESCRQTRRRRSPDSRSSADRPAARRRASRRGGRAPAPTYSRASTGHPDEEGDVRMIAPADKGDRLDTRLAVASEKTVSASIRVLLVSRNRPGQR